MADVMSPNDDQLLSIEQVAERLNVSKMTVTRMAERGDLPVHRFVRRMRFRPPDVMALLNKSFNGPLPANDAGSVVPSETKTPTTCHCDELMALVRSFAQELSSLLELPAPQAQTMVADVASLVTTPQLSTTLTIHPSR